MPKNWKKEPPCLEPYIGCLNCGGGEMIMRGGVIVASMKTRIYNGFGGWYIQRDGKCFFQPDQDKEWDEYPTLMKFENAARKNPDHDWRAVCFLPLRDATYQRQGKTNWVLIKSGEGFA